MHVLPRSYLSPSFSPSPPAHSSPSLAEHDHLRDQMRTRVYLDLHFRVQTHWSRRLHRRKPDRDDEDVLGVKKWCDRGVGCGCGGLQCVGALLVVKISWLLCVVVYELGMEENYGTTKAEEDIQKEQRSFSKEEIYTAPSLT